MSSIGSEVLNVIIVLKFGFAPRAGSVVISDTATAFSGGSIDLTLNLINGFLIGIIPKDSNSLRPRMFI